MSDLRNLIDRALNPSIHGVDSDHCPACFGSCGAFPGEWTEDAEELAAALAKALEALLDKANDEESLTEVLWGEIVNPAIRYREVTKAVAAVSAYLLGEEMNRGEAADGA